MGHWNQDFFWFPAVWNSPFWTHFWSLRNKYLSFVMDFRLLTLTCTYCISSSSSVVIVTWYDLTVQNIIFKTIYCSEASVSHCHLIYSSNNDHHFSCHNNHINIVYKLLVAKHEVESIRKPFDYIIVIITNILR